MFFGSFGAGFDFQIDPQISKTILRRKIEVGELKLPNYKTFYNATVIGMVEY